MNPSHIIRDYIMGMEDAALDNLHWTYRDLLADAFMQKVYREAEQV